MAVRPNFEMQEDESGIDMTPMLDIVFIMLIFFIVTTTFVRDAGVEINRPQAQSAEPVKAQGARIAITADGEIWLDKQQLDIRMVRPALERLRADEPNLGVLIQADKEAGTGLLIEVLDVINLMGIEQVAVATREDG
ncbi:ExbD/TolR family protein [Aliamphritea spongicola]|uniref:ExbD/TolR family protein n=1 Tax=Aliamphritea spongicola TaxID=707589 RepID=UPI00196B7A3A|nr:biopolymer transporter ExbD [Aliamphritea spongicola]MBN3564341.1 biopolymer transporter ExbD [Aliamphritea spongicola]